jgi:hypothetical protein
MNLINAGPTRYKRPLRGRHSMVFGLQRICVYGVASCVGSWRNKNFVIVREKK